jgi:NarL family two-component system response regulator LiaR
MLAQQNSKPNMILVDDHLIFRQGLKDLITIENIASVIGEASNGVEFLKLLPNQKPDLVLMDIDMPLMNGLEATRRALALIPDLKIMAFTMFGDNEYNDKIRELGAKGFVSKTVNIEELELAIETVLGGQNYFQNTDSVISTSI